MIYMFLAAIFGMFSLQFFCLNFSIQGLNRAIISTPISYLIESIQEVDGDAKFLVDKTEENLLAYYDKTLTKYVKDYDIEIYFYNTNDNSMCLTSYCDGLEIRVDATILLTYQYHRVMYYELTH